VQILRRAHVIPKLEKCIVLAAGGTGGHVFPAQALAAELSAHGYNVYVFSDGRGQQFKDSSVSTLHIPSAQCRGSWGGKVKGGVKLITGIGVSLYHLRRLKPCAVVGFGGYAAFPTMMAAALLRLPTIVHQADAYFGRTNRYLSPYMTRIATSFPHVDNIPFSCQNKVSLTGLPVRPEIKPEPYVPSEEKDPFHILITGGSQGARVFGDIIPQAIRLLEPALQRRLSITQQCRPEFLESTRALYEQTKAHVELSPFLENMGEQYKRAQLIISRAGASSVVEAALVGRPALFVPYPFAMDDHQFYNAQQVINVEGGWAMREKDFTVNTLSILLSELMTSPWKLSQAAVNIQSIAIPDASSRFAHLVNLIAS
jgi:UDP-N-acetylglucosamine--N-acetylmuramyl-(pentapeptide) pyrophosphoryl-undecaprenol N-acetylglucosamine transferase